MNAFFSALANVPRVIVLTVKVDRDYTANNNQKLFNLLSQFPNVTLIDWAGLSASCGDCFYDDGYHINQAGQDFYTELIVQAIGI